MKKKCRRDFMSIRLRKSFENDLNIIFSRQMLFEKSRFKSTFNFRFLFE